MLVALSVLSVSAATAKEGVTVLESVPCQAAMLQKVAESAGVTPDKLKGSNANQEAFLKYAVLPSIRDSKYFPDIKSVAGSPEKVNQFLKKEGFTIQLIPKKGETAAAATLKSSLSWVTPGTVTTLTVKAKSYPAVTMAEATGRAFTYGNRTGFVLIARNGDWDEDVYIVPLDPGEAETYTPSQLAVRVFDKHNILETGKLSVTFPMVSVDKTAQLVELVGISAADSRLSQVLSQTKFDMDELGAHVEAAAAALISRGQTPPNRSLIINKPFLLFVMRNLNYDYASMPVVAGYFYPDSWKKPKAR